MKERYFIDLSSVQEKTKSMPFTYVARMELKNLFTSVIHAINTTEIELDFIPI